VSGRAHLERLYLERPFASDAELRLESAALEVQSVELRLARPGALRLKGGRAESDGLELAFQTPSGQRGLIDARASLDSAMNVSAELALRETTLGVLAPALPGVSRADGRLAARLGVSGRLSEPIIEGQLEVTRGELGLSGLDAPLTELELTVAVDRTGVAVRRGSARWGGGTVTLTGGAPLSGGALGRVDLGLKLRDVNLPVADDVRVRFDADLRVDVPAPGDKEARLPRLTGSVDVLSGDYRRPVSVTADLASLASRARKSEVEVYDPEEDLLELDVLVRSRGPLKVAAELVEAEMLIDDPGLRVTGTNQRFGAVGSVEVPAGGQLIMRGSKFEVTSGSVRFNDATRLRPEVDVSAVTEYRRYQDRDLTTVSSATPTSSLSTTTGGRGSWRILLHGYGPPDSLRVDLTSDPPLAQDDIFLLLTVGMTRTELDQSQQSGVGQSVALEALGSLSGAESAVTKTVPIDEFRFGSTYSSRSGRTEPTVTIGKRLSERIRASVTTSLSDSNELRSNIEYRATESLSFEGSYDNAQSSGSTNVGNVGGDVRWRLEFE
jgi:translocation and assembly module TamB